MADTDIPNAKETFGFKPKILLAEDDSSLREVLKALLTQKSYEVVAVPDGQIALDVLGNEEFHCVLTDIRMPNLSGEELCQRILQKDSHLPVIILTGYGNIQNAVDNLKAGAFDYITKPFSDKDLLERLQRAVERRNLDQQIHQLKDKVAGRRFSDYLIGSSEAMKKVYNQINTISKNDITVFVSGESGTGKELVARTIHMTSTRAKGKFVTVNCGAIPENLMESELFGHIKGAFTGAVLDKVGLFEEAHEGTIFLDEIGEMPLALQVKLLRVLQENEIRRVGDNKTRKVDVRIIAATNRELKKEVEQGRFREDLYYRINVFPLEVPPLRERQEDITVLINFFVELYNKELKMNIQGFSPAAIKKLMRYHWPGNVRELQNKVKQAMVVTRRRTIGVEDVLLQLPLDSDEHLSFKEAKKKFEREYLIQILKMTAGNITEASKIAKKDRKDFYDVMKKHGIHPEEFRH